MGVGAAQAWMLLPSGGLCCACHADHVSAASLCSLQARAATRPPCAAAPSLVQDMVTTMACCLP